MPTVSELIVKIEADNKQLKTALKQVQTDVKKFGNQAQTQARGMSKSMQGLGNAVESVGTNLVAAFSFGAVVSLGQKIIETTAEFQKFAAVLEVSLGSAEASAAAFSMIQDVASKTPFSVKELTDSFVKLTNQGLSPTSADLIKLGDLAAATGKSFDQLAEASLDAVNGEFERLKEFGIKASKAGDKVTFAFKGQKVEVDNTKEAINNYLLSLGEMDGVSGSMAAVSETLGGKISNLGDSFDTLFNTIGEGAGGPVTGFIARIKDATDWLTQAFSSTTSWEDRLKLLARAGIELMARFLLPFKDIIQDITGLTLEVPGLDTTADKVGRLKSVFGGLSLEQLRTREVAEKWLRTGLKLGLTAEQAQSSYVKWINSQTALAKAQADANGEGEETVKVIKKIKPLAGEMEKVYTRMRLGVINALNGVKEETVKFSKDISTIKVDVDFQMLDSAQDSIAEMSQGINQALDQAAKDIAQVGFETVGAAIGEAFTGGDLMQIGQAFVSQVGEIVSSIGKQMISLGIAAVLAKESLKSLFANPALAIAAGVGLVAVGAAMKNLLDQGVTPFADGGIVSGPTLGLVGEYPGARSNPEVIAPLNKLQSMIGGGGGKVQFEIMNDRLTGSLSREAQRRDLNT